MQTSWIAPGQGTQEGLRSATIRRGWRPQKAALGRSCRQTIEYERYVRVRCGTRTIQLEVGSSDVAAGRLKSFKKCRTKPKCPNGLWLLIANTVCGTGRSKGMSWSLNVFHVCGICLCCFSISISFLAFSFHRFIIYTCSTIFSLFTQQIISRTP